MATVTSLTKTKIEELLAGWSDIDLSQQEILALIGQLYIASQSTDAQVDELKNQTIAQFQNDLIANQDRLNELNDAVLPDLQTTLDQAKSDLENLNTVDIPSLRTDLDSEMANSLERPIVYSQDYEPENPDENGRDLVLGDTWFDTDDNNLQRTWNGVEWTSMSVDIPDLSLTVKKFNTSTHMIY